MARKPVRAGRVPTCKDFSAWHAVVRVCRGDTVIVRMGESQTPRPDRRQVPGLADPTGRAAERFLENLLAGEAGM